MKTFVLVAACLAIALVGVAPSKAENVEGHHPQCPELQSSTEVTCNRWQLPVSRAKRCILACLVCYGGNQDLEFPPGCLVGHGRRMKCVCLEKNATTTTTTTETPGETTPVDEPDISTESPIGSESGSSEELSPSNIILENRPLIR